MQFHPAGAPFKVASDLVQRVLLLRIDADELDDPVGMLAGFLKNVLVVPYDGLRKTDRHVDTGPVHALQLLGIVHAEVVTETKMVMSVNDHDSAPSGSVFGHSARGTHRVTHRAIGTNTN